MRSDVGADGTRSTTFLDGHGSAVEASLDSRDTDLGVVVLRFVLGPEGNDLVRNDPVEEGSGRRTRGSRIVLARAGPVGGQESVESIGDVVRPLPQCLFEAHNAPSKPREGPPK